MPFCNYGGYCRVSKYQKTGGVKVVVMNTSTGPFYEEDGQCHKITVPVMTRKMASIYPLVGVDASNRHCDESKMHNDGDDTGDNVMVFMPCLVPLT